MDWRLIAAVAAAAGSFSIVAVGGYAILTAKPQPQRQTFAQAPPLTSEHPFPVAATPSLQPPSSSQASQSAFTAGDDSTPISPFASGAAVASEPVDAFPPPVIPPLVADKPLRPHPEPRAGSKTAALGPSDDVHPRELPARPLVEPKRPPVVPELHAALPPSHYRGVLTAAEISRIRHNLRLTPEQEPGWPRVEAALAEMGRQQMALIRAGQEPRISPNDWPPSRLYAVAGPLLQTLRPDQKETVRKVCRSLGFESVASML